MYDEYLSAIGVSDVIKRRIETLQGLLATMVPTTLVPELFISNLIDEEKNNKWTSAWFYGPTFCSEFAKFQSTEKFDGVVVKRVRRWECTSENFDFQSATPNSRLGVTWTTGAAYGELSAVGSNCDFLLKLMRTLVLPNVDYARPPDAAPLT